MPIAEARARKRFAVEDTDEFRDWEKEIYDVEALERQLWSDRVEELKSKCFTRERVLSPLLWTAY
jgi:hypothetical protein